MKVRTIQFLLSIVFVVGYMAIIGIIFYIEVSDTLTLKTGENSLMGEVKILIGVLTAGVAQVLNFWFNQYKKKEADNESNNTDAP